MIQTSYLVYPLLAMSRSLTIYPCWDAKAFRIHDAVKGSSLFARTHFSRLQKCESTPLPLINDFFAKFVFDCYVITGSWFPMDWYKVSQLTLYRLRICCQSSVPLWWQTQGTPVEEARQNVFVMQLPLALLISGCFACRAILIATHLCSTVTLWECCRLTGEVGFCYDQIIVLGLWKSYGDVCTGRLMHALP